MERPFRLFDGAVLHEPRASAEPATEQPPQVELVS